jgi:hypothetical protein
VVPSMALFICTPVEPQHSWRVGRVTSSLKDRATEHSTAMRHSVEHITQVDLLVAEDDAIVAIANSPEAMPESTLMPFMMALRADGGSDRNPKHAAVVIGSLNTFFSLNLDVLVVLVTAADISHVNEVEGVMPTMNLGLQNQAFERQRMSEQCEQQFKHANSGKMIRELIAKQPTDEAREACQNAWRGSVEVPRRAIENLLSQSVYTQHAVQMFDPASDSAVVEAFTYLREKLDPTIDPTITTWAGVRKKNPDLCKYVKSHVTIECYHLEIKKCVDDACKTCRPVSMIVGSNFRSVICKNLMCNGVSFFRYACQRRFGRNWRNGLGFSLCLLQIPHGTQRATTVLLNTLTTMRSSTVRLFRTTDQATHHHPSGRQWKLWTRHCLRLPGLQTNRKMSLFGTRTKYAIS